MPRLTRAALTSALTCAVIGLLLALGGCGDSARLAPHDGPIVLITLDALRADVVGALGGPPGLTPSLDQLAGEAQWVARAISASSWTVPAIASVLTGLQPFRHQCWTTLEADLRADFETLPEALKAAGYATRAFVDGYPSAKLGYAQGFDSFEPLGEGTAAAAALAALGPGRTFLWLHVLPPHAPYIRRAQHDARVPAELRRPDLPERIGSIRLHAYFDPARPIPERLRRDAWALYLYNVAEGDRQAGELLSALRRSGQWDRALVVVTADHGEDFGESGQMAHGGNLGRALLEVPLLVKWPRGRARPLDAKPDERAATQRLFATLLAAAGRPVSDPRVAPALGDRRAGPWPVLSELYYINGVNLFSLVQGDRQLLWTSRHAPADPDFYRAIYAMLGGRPDPPLATTPRAVFERLAPAFTRSRALAGSGSQPPHLELVRWLEQGGVEAIDDQEARDQWARLLAATWKERNGEDAPPIRAAGPLPALAPEETERLRALGYVVGNR